MEELITAKIEDEFRSTDHLKDVHSSVSTRLKPYGTIRIDMDNMPTQKKWSMNCIKSLQNVQGLPPEVLNPPKLGTVWTPAVEDRSSVLSLLFLVLITTG